jgi:hypothetical protein
VSNNFNITKIKSIKKKIYKSNHYLNYFPQINSIPSGIQNTYADSKHENFYVTSTGLPNYPIFSTDNKKTVLTQGSGITSSFYVENHQLINGEFIYYNSDTPQSGISTGYYYVTRVDSNNIKLSYSKSDIFSKKYIFVNSGISSDTIVKSGFENKSLKNQKILKVFPLERNPILFDDPNKRKTTSRPIGLLVNGVEILSPSLFDENIYYGTLDSIEVINPGKNYDVVNTPPIEIKDDVGSSVKAHLNLSGSIKKVKIVSPGVGYKEKPKITISGGNGKGCALDCNLISSRLRFGFKADINVNSVDNTVTFLENILFENGEEVIYDANTNNNLPGLVDGSRYFIGIVTSSKIKIYKTQQDAVNVSNEIDITGISSGFHYFSSLKNKNTITEVYVKDPGQGYSNRTIKVPSILSADNRTLGINTFDSYFFARNHGFLDGELVQYSTTGSVISGLSTSIYYYVSVIDSNKFKLASAGIGTTLSDIDYLEKRFVKFNNLGLGTHSVSYPPIQISVETTSAIGSTTIITPVLEPLVLGSIDDVYVEDGGIGFGCTDIINFHRRPTVGISSIKSEAILKPIIINGTIVDVKIINKGRGYRKDSDIIISGTGSFAEIDPIIDSDGRLSAVNILGGGIGYGISTTNLTLQNRGSDAKFLANVTEWKINQVIKLKNQISPDDDGILYPNTNSDLELQFVNFYIPKKLRYQLSDNFTETDKETSGKLIHSPILGFAYDGNPIYGPYGFNSTQGGFVRQIKSSYILNLNPNPLLRPPVFEPGYFINDYIYNGSGDLDENNGRFCVTPQYPNGTYAYFYSISIDSAKRSTPSYPYVVANNFYDTPLDNNFLPKYNQDFNIFSENLTRNIAPYYLDKQNSFYQLIDKVVDEYKQEFRILDIQSSPIDDIIIFSPGEDYKVGDDIVFNNEGTSGVGANIVVSEIQGKEIESLSIVKNKLDNVTFIIRSNKITGIVDYPHDIKNNEIVSISGISTITSDSLSGQRKVQVTQKSVQLLKNIDTLINTGISTIIFVKDVSGFKVNDFIGIGTEKLLITRVSPERSAFYVNRIENTGIHTAGLDEVDLLPKKFEFNLTEPLTDFTFENTVTFFDPKESVGTGTAGVTRTIVGLGTSSFVQRFLPSRRIYIPNHIFFTGQELTYNCGSGGTSLYVNNVGSGQSFALQQNQTVYAVNLGNNYIGLSTLGFTTSTGIGTNLNSLEFWNLTEAFGVVGSAHSLTTKNKQITGTVVSSGGIVTTTNDHGLETNDIVSISLSSSIINEIKLKYDSINRKLLVNEVLFSNSDVSISNNTIDLSTYSGEVKTGDKVVYFASTPIGGLINGGIYYVLKEDFSKIKLCLYESDTRPLVGSQKNVIDFTTTGSASQVLYFINPPLNFIKGNTIKFDLSDPSLLDMDITFYSDSFYSKRLDIIGNDADGFAIVRSGIPGNNDAYVTLDTSNVNFPNILYYNLIFKSPIEETKVQLSSDYSVSGNNQIVIKKHSLIRTFEILKISDNEFRFVVDLKFSNDEMLSINSAKWSYKTTSLSASGPISDLRINFGGRGYKKLPSIRSIQTQSGKNAILKLRSQKIGRVESYERIKDGFDYPTDPTLTPRLSVPVICGIKDIRTISNVGILTGGRKYNNPPELLVKDDPNIRLSCSIRGGAVSNVDIINNSTSLSSPLEIISIRNSNGYEIDNITYIGNSVTLELSNTPGINPLVSVGYGNTQVIFPFDVDDEIFIENCRLTSSTRDKANFNSSSYDYKFFTVTGISTINNTVTYTMSGISTGPFGVYNDEFNLGMVINKKDMPVFQMNLNDDVSYQSSERVISNNFTAIVMENGWDNSLNQIRLNDGFGTLKVGDYLYGERSKVNGKVDYFDIFDLKSTLGVSRDKVISVDNAIGILNDFQQRISDNFYYQKFSYSLKSDISYDKWRESVRSIVHPSGFKEFSDLVIYTNPTNVGYAKSTNMRVKLNDSTSSLSINVDNEISMYERPNFARVYEDFSLEDGSTESIYFTEGLNLRPFIINKTNKVLKIDDISDQFDGTSIQELEGRYVDASNLLDLNRQFIQEEVVAFVEFNYPNIGLSTTYDAEKCKRDVGYIVDAVSHDIKYNSNDKSVEAGLAYWNAGSSYVINETEETLFAYNYVKFLGQYVINNQTPPTLYQSSVSQEFDFEIIQDPLNLTVNRYKDARNLILANKREIQDKSLASVAVGFPDFYFPPDPQTTFRSRYADGYRLIQQNKEEIIDTSWNNTLSAYPGISTTQTKCKRDIGYFIDAISVDVFLGGNSYTKQFILQYFNQGSPISNGLVGEEAESIFAFVQARNLMRSAVRNGLTIQDLTVTAGPSVYGVGTTVGVTSTTACTDVQNNISTLVGIVTFAISIGSTSTLPATNVGTYTSGQSKCFRDLGYIIDGVAQDISYGTNQHTLYNTKKYFTGAGIALTSGLVGEESQSIYAFETAKSLMKKSITNQLNVKNLTIIADPLTGFNTDPNSCANIQTNIDTLVGILTVSIGNSSLSGIPTENYGTADCADVRTALGNYVGIITTIIGLGTNFAPIIVLPSISRGGGVVGLSTFKLKNKGTSLFSHIIVSSASTYINLELNKFIIPNHNFQTGHELVYEYTGGSPIGIATTSYTLGNKTEIMQVGSINGTAILEQGYDVAISTSITGVSTVLSPVGPTFRQYTQVVGIGTTSGINATFNVFITYSPTTGQPLSTSIILKSGGTGYFVGQTVSIAGTYIGGITPTNNLSFVVSNTGPSGIQTQANSVYTNVPSTDLSGALFKVTRGSSGGYVSNVEVTNPAAGYASTSVISIAGTYIGGSSNDYITFTPLELGTSILPQSLFVYKLNDNEFRVFGLSTSSRFLNLTGFGTGFHTLSYKDPNPSVIVTIDGVIQSAIRRKSLTVSLGSSVATATTAVLDISSGISSLNTYDILNLNNEYLLVKGIGITSSNYISVERGYLGTIAGMHTVGTSVTVLNGDFNIVKDTIYFTTPPYGKIGPVGLKTGSIFGGRVFSRQFDASIPQDRNIILDDISLSFTGIAATEFLVKTGGQTTTTLFNDINNSSNVNNNPIVLINNVFQTPQSDFTVDNDVTNVLKFLSGTPSSGKITKVDITTGFGYQPRVAAAATVIVSAAGTISSIIIDHGGLGYRQPPAVSVSSTIGTGATITAIVGAAGTITGFNIINPGFGYTLTSIPKINIGIPTGYTNLPVAYTGGSSGVGQGAKVTVEVGMGSSIISFKFDEVGVGYKVGDILSVPGITTNIGIGTSFSEFRITVQEIQTDKFAGFYPGQFILFNDIAENFNGFRKKFTLSATINGTRQVLSLKTPIGSDLDITNNIFIYINDILQIPVDSYTFQGSRIIFKEAPKQGAKCVILYYRGSSVDVEEIEPPKTIKVGDSVVIQENREDPFDISQFERTVRKITASDQLDTFTYSSVGIITDPTKERPLIWKKQTQDRIITGSLFAKARPNLQSNIRPNATIIKSISPDDTAIYVDNAFPIFAGTDNLTEDLRNLFVVENRTTEAAEATATVSVSSTVSSITVTSPGVGYAYTMSPYVNISLSAISIKDPIYEWNYVSGISGLSTNSQLNSLSFGERIISVGNSSLYVVSVDGSEWEIGNIGLGSTTNFNSVYSASVGTGSSDVILAVGSFAKIGKAIGYANTISSWTQLNLVEELAIPGYGAISQQPSTYNGTLKEIVYNPLPNSWITVGTAGSIFVGSGINTDTFVNRYSRTIKDLNSVAFGNGYFVAVGNDGTILTSNTGLFWELEPSPTNLNLNKIIFDGNNFIIAGNSGVILKSINRSSYELITTNLYGLSNFVNVKYNYGFYVVVTNTGDLYYSFDLSTWIIRDYLGNNDIKDLSFEESIGINGRYIAVGSASTVIYAEPVFHRAVAQSSVTSGLVTSIVIIDGGFGYSQSSPPAVMIEPDVFKTETIKSFKVEGDYGTIIGINTFISGTPGIGTTSPKIEFVLQSETYDNTTLGIGYSSLNAFGISNSELQKGDYFVITDSNVSTGGDLVGITTLLGGMSNYPNSRVGTSKSFIDGVYIVEDVTTPSLGIVTVTCNFAPMVDNYVKVYKRGVNNTGIGTNNYYGRYSWGKIYDYQNRALSVTEPQSFEAYTNNGLSGLSTSAKIFRTRGLLSN